MAPWRVRSLAPEGVKAMSIPATQIAIDKGAHQAANTGVFGALMEAGNFWLPGKLRLIASFLRIDLLKSEYIKFHGDANDQGQARRR